MCWALADSSPVRFATWVVPFQLGAQGCVARNDPSFPALINTQRQRLECGRVSPVEWNSGFPERGRLGGWGGGAGRGHSRRERTCAHSENSWPMSKTQGQEGLRVSQRKKETRPGEHRELGRQMPPVPTRVAVHCPATAREARVGVGLGGGAHTWACAAEPVTLTSDCHSTVC